MIYKKLKAASSATGRLYGRYSWLRWALRVTFVFVPIWLICYFTLDADFGWHLQAGNYIRAHSIPTHDIFSYTAESFRWIDHEWGSDVLLSYGFGLGGILLTSLVAAAIWSAAVLIAAGRRSNPLIMYLAVIAILPAVSIRPTAFTALFFVVTLTVLRGKHRTYYWLLPILFVVWANLHAGFISGLALIAYFAIRHRSKQLLLILGASFLATLCNAYGVRIYEEIFRTLGSSELHNHITEWLPFYIQVPSLPFIDIWLAGFWLYDKKHLSKWFGLGPILFLATLSANRNLVLFVLVVLAELPGYFRRIIAGVPRELDRPRRIVIGLLLIGAFYFLAVASKAAFVRISTGSEAHYPVAAVTFLRQHPCSGHLFNEYNYGGYLIWKLPDSKVYIDGRMPSWKPYMTTYTNLIDRPAQLYRNEFTKHDIRCALLSNSFDRAFIKVLKRDGWRTVSDDGRATLLLSPETTSKL